MFSPNKFSDGADVPYPVYRCKATAKDQRTATSSYTHRCREHIDHDGDHQCNCGKTWKPLVDANNKGEN